jgi:hypothetical protein
MVWRGRERKVIEGGGRRDGRMGWVWLMEMGLEMFLFSDRVV